MGQSVRDNQSQDRRSEGHLRRALRWTTVLIIEESRHRDQRTPGRRIVHPGQAGTKALDGGAGADAAPDQDR